MKLPAHPDFARILGRLKAVGRILDAPLEADLFRFINPKFSRAADIVSGKGALHASGRWNVTGVAPLSYAALAPETALAEALAHVDYYKLPRAKALPRVLVALRFQGRRVLDLRDGKARRRLRLPAAIIRQLDWRAENRQGREAATQAWGHAFAAAGFEAVVVPSAVDPKGANVLVFPENLLAGSRFGLRDKIHWPKK